MLKMSTILYATDMSELSKGAFPLACSLARDHGAKLIVLHVIPSGTHQFLTVAQLGQGESAAQFEDDLRHDLQRHYPVAERVLINYKLGKGDPATAIIKVAEEMACDLIVLGTHGRTGFRRVLMGSVAEHVMRTAPCPVLVVRTNPP
jgi:nucleotide-binding universal stress UspA family protein